MCVLQGMIVFVYGVMCRLSRCWVGQTKHILPIQCSCIYIPYLCGLIPHPPKKYIFYWSLHLSRTPQIIILSPPRINPAGFLTQFSLPDSLNATKGQKQNHRSVACLFACQFTISNQSSLFYYPFAAPPSFLLPSPLLFSYPLVAIAITVAGAALTALALLAAAAAAAAACSACACTS